MARTRHVLMALFATAGSAMPTLAADSRQPPRRSPDPDTSQPSGPETRHAFSTYSGFWGLAAMSALFSANEFDFGLTDNDFITDGYGFEFDFTVLPQMDISLGFDTANADTFASFADFVFADDGEIEQSAWLSLTELRLGVRLRLFGGVGRIRPYLIGGVTGVYYQYSVIGDFVDFETADIYFDEFEERSFLRGLFAGAGADVAVGLLPDGGRVELFGEFRYSRSAGEHTEGFEGFGDLTLDRSGGIFGARIRW